MDHIDDMFRKYGGSFFYDYHNAFSLKADQYETENIPVDWASIDTKLYLTTFSGLRTISCEVCANPNHTQRFCPLNQGHGNNDETHVSSRRHFSTSGSSSSVPYGGSTVDKYGRPRIYRNGREVCNNYNSVGCTVRHAPAGPAHVCSICNGSHPAHQCNRNQHTPGVQKRQ